MHCPHCKGSVSLTNLLRDRKCPACGDNLRRMPTKEQIKETLISFSEDKGYIFWAIVYFIVLWTVAFFEELFGKGVLFDYMTRYEFRFILTAAFAGSIIDYYAKANVEVTAVRNKFIFRPPLYLRAFRRWTNVFLVLAVLFIIYLINEFPAYIYDPMPVVKWDVNVARNLYTKKGSMHINSVIPFFTFTSSFFLGLIWAIMGLVLTDDDMNDKRIRYFMEEMRVSRVKYYHRAAAIYIGGLAVAGVIYYNLVKISGLWFYIYNNRLVYSTVTFFKQYFGWVKHFVD